MPHVHDITAVDPIVIEGNGVLLKINITMNIRDIICNNGQVYLLYSKLDDAIQMAQI